MDQRVGKPLSAGRLGASGLNWDRCQTVLQRNWAYTAGIYPAGPPVNALSTNKRWPICGARTCMRVH